MKFSDEKMDELLRESTEATTEAFAHVLDKYFVTGDLLDFQATVQTAGSLSEHYAKKFRDLLEEEGVVEKTN